MKYLKLFTNKIEQFRNNGLLHIMIITIINKMLGFIGGIIIVRILTKSDFGFFTYASNLVAMAMLMSGFGIEYSIQQYCSEKVSRKKKIDYYKYGAKFGVCTNILIMIVFYIYVLVAELPIPKARPVVLMMLPFIILQFLEEYFRIGLRVTFQNVLYAKTIGINSFSHLIFSIIGAWLFAVKGYVIGLYASSFVTFIYIYYKNRHLMPEFREAKASFPKKPIIKYAISCAINNGLTNILYTMDVFILGIMIANEEALSTYKVGIALPFALYAIPTSVMTIAFPYFARQIDNKSKVIELTKKIISVLLVISICIAFVMLVLSSFIVPLLYGQDYADAVPLFRVCCITFVIATAFKIPFSTILSSQRLISFNLYCSIICAIVNVVGDIVLINIYGSIGAAYATLIVTIVSSLISIGIFYVRIFKYNKVFG